MDVVVLSRLQFAVAVFFHFIFVPLTLGLSVFIAIMESIYVKTGNEIWKKHAKFWGKLFLINFTLGVVTGITLEFQFGTNWSRYSEFVGDIFGSLLAIEATTSFFLESTFLAVWHFGWKKVGKKMHLASAWLVAIASNLSALWIIQANGFMQNPRGYEIIAGRAELRSFAEVITNPYAWGMYGHTVLSAWLLSAFFIMGVSAWHLLKNSNVDFFKASFRKFAPITLITVCLVVLMGHTQGQNVAKLQPTKLAAMESHWETDSNVAFPLIVIPDAENERNSVEALKIPGVMSFLATNDFNAEVKGLKDFAPEDRPSPAIVTAVFWAFRIMVCLGILFGLVALISCFQIKADMPNKLLLKILNICVPLPYITIALGWLVAEMGRQPWIVYNLMRTSDGASQVPSGNVLVSLIAFIVVYSVLGVIDIYLLHKYSHKDPDAE